MQRQFLLRLSLIGVVFWGALDKWILIDFVAKIKFISSEALLYRKEPVREHRSTWRLEKGYWTTTAKRKNILNIYTQCSLSLDWFNVPLSLSIYLPINHSHTFSIYLFLYLSLSLSLPPSLSVSLSLSLSLSFSLYLSLSLFLSAPPLSHSPSPFLLLYEYFFDCCPTPSLVVALSVFWLLFLFSLSLFFYPFFSLILALRSFCFSHVLSVSSHSLFLSFILFLVYIFSVFQRERHALKNTSAGFPDPPKCLKGLKGFNWDFHNLSNIAMF